MGGKEKTAKVAIEQIFSWAVKGATSLWTALGPVWSTFSSLWKVLNPIWDVIYGVYEWVAKYVEQFYRGVISPVVDVVATVVEQLNAIVDYVDKLYDQTIGRIERVYDILFGRIEALWKHIEETTEKIARVAGIFSKDLGESILKLLDNVEASTIGQIRDMKDELTHTIDNLYTTLRDRMNDMYYAVMDVVNPVVDKIFKIGDDLGISFEKPDLLSKETIVKSADIYGQDWFDVIHRQTTRGTKDVITRGQLSENIHTFIDDYVGQADEGVEGLWSDVTTFIENNVKAIDSGDDPTGFDIDLSLLPPEEAEELRRVKR